ncbi:hypothetical protein JCM30566_00250 [Marinitoga arctica]
MKDKGSFRDFFLISLSIFIGLFLIIFYLNTSYLERTVEEIVDRSSISAVKIVSEYSSKYIDLAKNFSNDLNINAYSKSLIYIIPSYEKNKEFLYKSTYDKLEKYIQEKKDMLLFKGNIIISNFDHEIIYPRNANLLNLSLFENNLTELDNSENIIMYSPIFQIKNNNYIYISTYLFGVNQIPSGFITLEININFDYLTTFFMDELKFYIVDSKTKTIWPNLSLPYFIYSKIFLSKEGNSSFNFNGKIYSIKKTNFGNSVYVLSIFENKYILKYSFLYFLLLTLFFSNVLIIWMRRYFKYEDYIFSQLKKISNNLGVDDVEIVDKTIERINYTRQYLFKEIKTFEDLENNLMKVIKLHDDIIYFSFFKKQISDINYSAYEIYSSENINVSKEIIGFLETTKNVYKHSFEEKIFDFDGIIIIKEKKFGDFEFKYVLDGIIYMLKELYMKMSTIYNKEYFEKLFFNYNFKTTIILKFKDKLPNLPDIKIFKSYIIKYNNNYIFLIHNETFMREIVDYINILMDFEGMDIKYILFNVPKYGSKKKKLFREIERVLNEQWENLENIY